MRTTRTPQGRELGQPGASSTAQLSVPGPLCHLGPPGGRSLATTPRSALSPEAPDVPKGIEPLKLCQRSRQEELQLCQTQQILFLGRRAAVLEPFWHSQQDVPASSTSSPSQLEQGALRQWENPGLGSLHQQDVQGIHLVSLQLCHRRVWHKSARLEKLGMPRFGGKTSKPCSWEHR